MKKVISTLLAVIIVFSCFTVTAFAEDDFETQTEQSQEHSSTDTKDMIRELFLEKFSKRYDQVHFFQIYYHYSKETGDLDWVLINANSNMCLPWLIYESFGNKVVTEYNEGVPFRIGLCVFDAKSLEFYSLESAYNNKSDFEGLEGYIEENIGRRIGDVDNDGALSIIDATIIQKCLAEIRDFPQDDVVDGNEQGNGFYHMYGEKVDFISDFNRDSKRNIEDATAIQMYLASVE